MNSLPPGWEHRALLDIVSLPNGQVSPVIEPFRSQDLVAPDHIESKSGRITRRESAAKQGAISGKYQVHPGDVLYSKIRPALRKAALSDFHGTCSADMYPLRPSSEIHAGFLLQVILGEDFSRFAESVSGRSGIPKVNRSELAEFSFATPPLPEQRKIAEVLDTIDESVRSTERLIAKLERAKKGLVHDLLRALAADSSTSVTSLRNVVSQTFSGEWGNDVSGTGDTARVIRATELDRSGYLGLDSAATRRIPRLKLHRKALRRGDLVLEASGGSVDRPVGRVGLFDFDLDPDAPEPRSVFVCSNFFRTLRLAPNVLPKYAWWLLNYSYSLPSIWRYQQQTTGILNLKLVDYMSQDFILPNLAAQKRTIDVMAGTERRLEAERLRLEKLRLLKLGSMHDLLTGRVRVDVREEASA